MDNLYQKLFSELPCYVTAQDREFRFIAANHKFQEEFGGTIGDYCYEVYKGRSEKCPVCPVEMTFQDGQVHSSEEIVRGKNGTQVCVIVYTAPIKNDANEIVAAVELSADITKIKHLQQKYHTLFDVVPCYISVQDRDLKISDVNKRFEQDFGEGIGRLCYEVYKHREEPCTECPVAETFQDGRIHKSEEVVTSRDGEHKNVICRTAPIRNPSGEIESVMEMSADITDLRQLQDRLTSLGMLVGSISHGIKGLLNGLDGGIYLMDTGFKNNKEDRVRQGWDMLQRNVERIRNMVLNILYYAKDREVFWESIDVKKAISSVEDVISSNADKIGVDLKMQKVEEGSFEGDRLAIHSLLVNLLENSFDACRVDKNKVAHTVSLSAYFEGDHLVFDVIDNGIGMDQETREKAFSLFFSSKGAEGTGLGLFIAHKIVTSHNGTIDIESEPGEGTRIIVRFARQRPQNRGGI